jgi:hypothetical protein
MEENVEKFELYENRFYVRVKGREAGKDATRRIFGNIRFIEREDARSSEFAFTTKTVTEGGMSAMIAKLKSQNAGEVLSVIRIAD